MSELNEQGDSELFDTDTTESATDFAIDTDNPNGEQEQEHQVIDLGDEVKSSTEEQRQKQIEAWQRKLDSGQVSLEGIPAAFSWVKPHLVKKSNNASIDVDVNALIEQKLAEKEAEREFKSKKAILQSMKLTLQQRKEIQAEYSALTSKGLPNAQALDISMRLAGVEADPEANARAAKRSSMALPTEGRYGTTKATTDTPYNEARKGMSEQERIAHLEKIRRGNN